jgi:hypothetical protein
MPLPSAQAVPTRLPLSVDPWPLRSRLRRLWLAEAVRQTELHTGWLDDEAANRLAQSRGGSFADRLQWRAWALAQRDGLLAAQTAWWRTALLAIALLLLLALASGLALAWAALASSARTAGPGVINIYQALLALLGMNGLALLVWLLGLVLASSRRWTQRPAGSSWLGALFLWLNSRLSGQARQVHLAPALLAVLNRARLTVGLLGLLSHGFWLVALGAALLTLLLLLSTRHYGFVWESTLLDAHSWVSWTQALGALPAKLGFVAPDAQALAASGRAVVTADGVRQQWALWLVGVVLVYGLLPRLLLALLCMLWTAFGWRRLRLDEELPGYRLLRSRLMPAGESLGVSDAAPASIEQASWSHAARDGQGAVLFAVELGADHEWPPSLPEDVQGDVHDGGRLDSGGQRRTALAQLQASPAERLLVACDARRSPDRGTLRLLVALAEGAREARIWLLTPPRGQEQDSARWADWQQALGEAGLQQAPLQALAWLERGEPGGRAP